MTTQTAAVYARYSTDKQSGASIADQFRVCERIAAQQGFRVVARFDDAAISGGTANRGGYQQLLAAARRRAFNVIVAEDISRLWRNAAEQAPRLAELSDLGIAVVTHDLDTRQETAGILAGVTGAISEQYRREIGRRTRRGLEGRAQAGKPTGGRAFGYVAARDSGTGDIAINKQEARTVQRIFRTYAAGQSPRQIAATLNAGGTPAPGATWARKVRRKDAKWLQTAVRAILRNEKYVGRVVWGRTTWTRKATDSSRRTVRAGEAPVVHVREDLRIIDDTLWQQVQRRIKEMHRGAGEQNALARPHKHPLSGLLRCGECGASFVIADSYHYACASYRDGGVAACSNSIRVRRRDVEDSVYEGIANKLLAPAFLMEFSRWYRQQVEAGNKAQAAQQAANGERLATLERQIKNTTDAIMNGGLGASRSLADRLLALEAERDELARQQPPRNKVANLVPKLMEKWTALVLSLPAIAKADPARARAVLRQVVGGSLRLGLSGGETVVEFEATGARLALALGADPGSGEVGGSGGSIVDLFAEHSAHPCRIIGPRPGSHRVEALATASLKGGLP